MCGDEVAEHELQDQGMLVIAARTCRSDVVEDDALDPRHAVRALQQIVPELGCDDFGQMLMLRDGVHFLFRQIA